MRDEDTATRSRRDDASHGDDFRCWPWVDRDGDWSPHPISVDNGHDHQYNDDDTAPFDVAALIALLSPAPDRVPDAD